MPEHDEALYTFLGNKKSPDVDLLARDDPASP